MAIGRHLHDRAHAEAEQDSLFHPAVDAPARRGGRIGFGGAHDAGIQRGDELLKQARMVVAVLARRLIEGELN